MQSQLCKAVQVGRIPADGGDGDPIRKNSDARQRKMSRRGFGKYGVAHKEDRTHDGIVFDSKGEMLRWLDLKLLERAGDISKLRHHVLYPLIVNGIKITDYEADFVYEEGGLEVVEDFKGVRTDVYRLKERLMKAVWGIDIRITGAKRRTVRRRGKSLAKVGKYRRGVMSAENWPLHRISELG